MGKDNNTPTDENNAAVNALDSTLEQPVPAPGLRQPMRKYPRTNLSLSPFPKATPLTRNFSCGAASPT